MSIRASNQVRRRRVTSVRILGMAVVAGMAIAIWFGIAEGDLVAESSQIWALPWGRVSLVDLYLGLAVFGGWVAVRQPNVISTLAWWVALVFLGNLAAGAYLTIAAFRSRDLQQLLLGSRASR